ncbi:MAG TPA: pantoate--beta-alanine ligase, partial [Bdellovibrionales bacterium]|nr:pantoate--beta-alanine ligase [Bdellovibrionales bacterium]
IEKDLAMLARENTDVAFLPIHDEIYGDRFRFEVREKEFTKMLCGATRPGHFEGVLTVVMKLFCLVRPTRAYFGEKDFQQLSLIRDMAKSFFLGVDVIGVPTVREADGLAMSSRNLLLKSEEREIAPRLYQIIKTAADAGVARRELSTLGFRVDYVEDVAGRRFAAAFLGSVRLIDNVEL